VSLNGKDVSHWPVQKLTTGASGGVLVIVFPLKTWLGQVEKEYFPGNVTLEIEEK
jgi:hypothetical protein